MIQEETAQLIAVHPIITRKPVVRDTYAIRKCNGCLPSSLQQQVEAQMNHDHRTQQVINEWRPTEALVNFDLNIPSLQQLLTTKKQAPSLTHNGNVDEFGFLIKSDQQTVQLDNKAANKNAEAEKRWSEAISEWHTYSDDRKRKVKQSLKKGIPNSMRGVIWKTLINIDAIHSDSVKIYSQLLQTESQFESQIRLDLPRSLPNHTLFKDPQGEGQRSMFNVLKTYSLYDKTVGYCQGMSFICAVLLLYVSEVEAFSMLRRIIQGYELSGLFEPNFPTLHKCFYIHEQLLELWLPRLSAHFQTHNICTSTYAFGWFTTLYINSLKFPYIVRIFDIFMSEGMNVIFRVSIAILKLMQKQLLAMEFDELLLHIKNLKTYFTFSPSELINCATEFSLSNKRLDKLTKEFQASNQ